MLAPIASAAGGAEGGSVMGLLAGAAGGVPPPTSRAAAGDMVIGDAVKLRAFTAVGIGAAAPGAIVEGAGAADRRPRIAWTEALGLPASAAGAAGLAATGDGSRGGGTGS